MGMRLLEEVNRDDLEQDHALDPSDSRAGNRLRDSSREHLAAGFKGRNSHDEIGRPTLTNPLASRHVPIKENAPG